MIVDLKLYLTRPAFHKHFIWVWVQALAKVDVSCSWPRDLTLTINSSLALFSYKENGAACPKFCTKILLSGLGGKNC